MVAQHKVCVCVYPLLHLLLLLLLGYHYPRNAVPEHRVLYKRINNNAAYDTEPPPHYLCWGKKKKEKKRKARSHSLIRIIASGYARLRWLRIKQQARTRSCFIPPFLARNAHPGVAPLYPYPTMEFSIFHIIIKRLLLEKKKKKQDKYLTVKRARRQVLYPDPLD